jgi:FKBP-type peptidyl-prolyl cis-trans isomerase SlyD
MNIAQDTVVTVRYEIFMADGSAIDGADVVLSYLHGGYGGIFPKVEEGLTGKDVGELYSITLEPNDAFGEYDAELIKIEPQSAFPKDVKIGMQFEGAPPDAEEEEYVMYTVTDIADGKVVVDGNHELAGERLLFKCTVMAVREATKDELVHGHAHDAHGVMH